MESFSIVKKQSKHRLIILEGFWGSGKSTIARYLQDQNGAISIPEPVHSDRNTSSVDISAWYIEQHERRWRRALRIFRGGRRSVICERSVLSSAAFEYVLKGHLSETMKKRVRQISSCRVATIVYLKPSRTLTNRGITLLRDVSVLRPIHRKSTFVSEYHKFFCKILPHDFEMKNIQYIKITDLLLRRFRKKVNEVSAAGVLIHNKKVVVLYDKKYKHYVLPQGHVKAGESLMQAAKREIIEETGYTDITYIKKLYSYQYHFPRANQTVFKSIHVYLFKLRTAKRRPQVLETHELYEARLVPARTAIATLHWPQDRLAVKKAMREIKMAPVH